MYFIKSRYSDFYGHSWSTISTQSRDDLEQKRDDIIDWIERIDSRIARWCPTILLSLGVIATLSMVGLGHMILGACIGMSLLVAAIAARLMRNKAKIYFARQLSSHDAQINKCAIDVPGSLIEAALDYTGITYPTELYTRRQNIAAIVGFMCEAQLMHHELDPVFKWLEAFPEEFYELLMMVGETGSELDRLSKDQRLDVKEHLSELVRPSFDHIAELHRLRKAEAKEWALGEVVILNEEISALNRVMNDNQQSA